MGRIRKMSKNDEGMTKNIVLFRHEVQSCIQYSKFRVYNATDVNDAEATIRNDVPHVLNIVDQWKDEGVTDVDWSVLALSQRTTDYILGYTFSGDGDVMQMVILNCKNEQEAQDGFRCMYKDPKNHIELIKVWDWKFTPELEKGYNVLTLQELRDYRDGK
jgi:hypothetical protein